ncbi:MAG: lysozyme inhibitor LprI family protein [Gemmatimonas sp.]
MTTPPHAQAAGSDARCNTPTNSAQRGCLIAEIDRNDVELTRTYQALIAGMRRAAGGVREPPSVQSLRAEQRAWMVQRDRACRPSGANSGPLWGAERVPCFARMSSERDVVLRGRLQDQPTR